MKFQLVPRLWRGLLLLWPLAALAGPAVLRLEPDPDRARVRFLGWDTEGGPRANTNLLRAGTGMGLRIQTGGEWREGADFPAQREHGPNATRYRLSVAPDAELVWNLERKGASLSRHLRAGQRWPGWRRSNWCFLLIHRVTPTTALPKAWNEDGDLLLPVVISAPDYGQFLLACKGAGEIERKAGRQPRKAHGRFGHRAAQAPRRPNVLLVPDARSPARAQRVERQVAVGGGAARLVRGFAVQRQMG